VKRQLLLLSLAALVACSSSAPSVYATTVGILRPGAAIGVTIDNGVLNAFRPAQGDPPTRFTVAASAYGEASPPPAPIIRPRGRGITVDATGKLANLLVRVPDGVDLTVNSQRGNVNITDITGHVDVHAGTGDVKIMIPGYAQVVTQNGNVDVTLGAERWPGTLHISSGNGDVTVYVRETAAFHARLHTDDGVLFTDFNLRGTSQGSNETIDAPVNGGSASGIDLESHKGAVRLLRLTPQA
jgi:hypothetical protein